MWFLKIIVIKFIFCESLLGSRDQKNKNKNKTRLANQINHTLTIKMLTSHGATNKCSWRKSYKIIILDENYLYKISFAKHIGERCHEQLLSSSFSFHGPLILAPTVVLLKQGIVT